ncbi:hypothetical protein Mapa_004663 [Marchantia paleacea]|nr:hypothetical protein Mapa_004663 [Marchantia paleacea]
MRLAIASGCAIPATCLERVHRAQTEFRTADSLVGRMAWLCCIQGPKETCLITLLLKIA